MSTRLVDERLDIVDVLVNDSTIRTFIGQDFLGRVPDFERLVRKFIRKKANLEDCYKIYVAVNKPQMLRMAARLGDGIMLSDLTPAIRSFSLGFTAPNTTSLLLVPPVTDAGFGGDSGSSAARVIVPAQPGATLRVLKLIEPEMANSVGLAVRDVEPMPAAGFTEGGSVVTAVFALVASLALRPAVQPLPHCRRWCERHSRLLSQPLPRAGQPQGR